MASTAQRVDLLFFGASGYGWTETYWYIPGGLTAPNSIVNNLIAARSEILATDCQILYVRLSSGYSRSPYLSDASGANNGPVDGQAAGTSGPDFVALVLRLQATTQGIGRIFMRGIPEQDYSGDELNDNPGFVSDLLAFIGVLRLNGVWGIRTSTTNVPYQRYNATALTFNLPRGYNFTSAVSLPGVTAGNYIRMHQAVNVGYNGLKKVVQVAGSGPYVYVVGGASPQQNDPGTFNPYVTIPTYNYNPIGSGIPERISRRSPGRFFGQRRGRRANTLVLRQ